MKLWKRLLFVGILVFFGVLAFQGRSQTIEYDRWYSTIGEDCRAYAHSVDSMDVELILWYREGMWEFVVDTGKVVHYWEVPQDRRQALLFMKMSHIELATFFDPSVQGTQRGVVIDVDRFDPKARFAWAKNSDYIRVYSTVDGEWYQFPMQGFSDAVVGFYDCVIDNRYYIGGPAPKTFFYQMQERLENSHK